MTESYTGELGDKAEKGFRKVYMSNKNPEINFGVQSENQKSKAAKSLENS